MTKEDKLKLMNSDTYTPATVRYDNRLNPNSKLFYSDITLMADEDGICYITAEEFSKAYGKRKETIVRFIKQLEKYSYIKVLKNKYTDEEVYNKLNQKNSQTGCLFCGYDKSPLDKHHYPVRKADGGEETIPICANCHREFHQLADYVMIIQVVNIEDLIPYTNKGNDNGKE